MNVHFLKNHRKLWSFSVPTYFLYTVIFPIATTYSLYTLIYSKLLPFLYVPWSTLYSYLFSMYPDLLYTPTFSLCTLIYSILLPILYIPWSTLCSYLFYIYPDLLYAPTYSLYTLIYFILLPTLYKPWSAEYSATLHSKRNITIQV